MNRAVIDEKLESLRRCLLRLEQRRPATVTDLEQDLDAQDILVLNLQRAVQICVDAAAQVLSLIDEPAPSTMAGTFEALSRSQVISDATAERMRRAVGFRNVAVHRYADIDWSVVHRIVSEHLDDFRRFARELDAWLQTR